MRYSVDPDVAGAGFDVLAHFGGDVGGTAQCAVAPCRIGHICRVSLAEKLACDCLCRFDALAERAEYLDAGAEGCQLAACLCRFHPDEIQAVGEAFGRDDVRHPSVAVSRGALERTFGASADPDRWSAGSSGTGLHAD